eukprot:COSAG06_NODE_717_length_12831_cov_52.780003_13_plen_97_part_00
MVYCATKSIATHSNRKPMHPPFCGFPVDSPLLAAMHRPVAEPLATKASRAPAGQLAADGWLLACSAHANRTKCSPALASSSHGSSVAGAQQQGQLG